MEIKTRVTRNEPGVLEAEAYNALVVKDGPMTVRCWWSEEDGCWLASLFDACEDARPFTSTNTAHGDTREAALAHLTISLYVLALAVAAPTTTDPSKEATNG